MQKLNRIYGLDLARALLLLGGPVVHSVLPHQNTPTLLVICEGSRLFRMSAFFAIAGFLVAVLPSVKNRHWLKQRVRQLLVPLLSVSALMLLFEIWIYHIGKQDDLGMHYFPMHLWFLISLLMITPAVMWMDTAGICLEVDRFFSRYTWTIVPFTIVIFIGMVGSARIINNLYYIKTGQGMNMIAATFVVLSPPAFLMYLFGLFMGRNAGLLPLMNKAWIIGLGPIFWLVSLAIYKHVLTNNDTPHVASVGKAAIIALEGVTNVLMSLSIILLALRIKKTHSAVMRFSKASYTVYLVHFPIIYIIGYNILFYVPDINKYALYIILVPTSLIMSYCIHLIISRSNFLLFLFNGKKWI